LSLAPHFTEALLVGDDGGAYPELSARRVPDLMTGGGAPAGLLSALAAARTPLILVVACDMPGVSLEAVSALHAARGASDEAAYFVDAGSRLHPFPGLYRGASSPALRARFVPGTSVHALLSTLALARVPLPALPWAERAVSNVNTWDDARALGLDA
jgi:molybdopterin-guanine dinucleotide biosynthesis protein A